MNELPGSLYSIWLEMEVTELFLAVVGTTMISHLPRNNMPKTTV